MSTSPNGTLALAIRTKADGPVVHRESVTEGDLFDLYGEAWLGSARQCNAEQRLGRDRNAQTLRQ